MEPVHEDPARPSGNATETASSLGEAADRISKRISSAIVIAGALIGLAVYTKPVPNHFQAFAAGGELFRVNAKSGTVIACNTVRCMTVVQRGQRLMSYRQGRLFQSPAAAPAPALAPPAAPAPPPSPEPAAAPAPPEARK